MFVQFRHIFNWKMSTSIVENIMYMIVKLMVAIVIFEKAVSPVVT